MRHRESLFSLHITDPRRLHNNTCVRSCCTTLGQRTRIDNQHRLNDLLYY
jgi:hypothetical protein